MLVIKVERELNKLSKIQFRFLTLLLFVAIITSFVSSNAYAYHLSVNTPGNTVIDLQNGQVKVEANQVTVQTDCRAGYSFQIQGPQNTNLYLSGDATNNEAGKFIAPISSSESLANQVNTYGYSLTSSQPSQIFTPLTSDTVTLKDPTQTATPSQDIDETTSIYWGANAGLTLGSGSYYMPGNGAATYLITANPICNGYIVNFDPNSGSGTMSPQEITPGIPTTLTPNAFTKTGFTFVEWNTAQDGTGTSYADQYNTANGEVENATNGDTVTLYAIWEKRLDDITYLQDITPQICADTPLNATATLADNRDNKLYTVQKLADGKCWMTSNLRLGNPSSGTNITLTPANSDVGANFTLPAGSTSSWGSLTDPANVNTPRMFYSGDDWASGNFTDTSMSIQSSGTPDTESRYTGNYYNWYTATAGTGTFATTGNTPNSICPKGWRLPTTASSGNDTDFTGLYYAYGNDPATFKAGSPWVLSGEYDSPTSTLVGRGERGGWWSSTATYGTSQYGTIFYVQSTGVGANGGASKGLGATIRCVARGESYTVIFNNNGGSGTMPDQVIDRGIPMALYPNSFTPPSGYIFEGWSTNQDGSGVRYTDSQVVTDLAPAGQSSITLYAQWKKNTIDDLSYLQDITPQICANTPLNETATLLDRRDDKAYTIQKLADGKCWMTSNLRLGIYWSSMALTPAESDITSNFTLPANNDGQWITSNAAFTDPAYIDVPRMYHDGITWLSGNLNGTSNMTIQTSGTPDTESRYTGNYYNWYTATAGTGTLSTIGNASNSICPKGWRLPTAVANNSDYVVLNSAYSNATEFKSSAPWVLAGWFNSALSGTRLSERGERGGWWSATALGNQYGAGLWLGTTGDITPSGGASKGLGLTVRCVARGESYTVKFNSNNGYGTMADQIIERGTSTALNPNTFTAPSDFVFDGWSTNPNGSGTRYSDKQSVLDLASAGGEITLYAQWKDVRYTVIFNGHGGSGTMSNQRIEYGVSTPLKQNTFLPPLLGYGFDKWTTNSDGTGASYSNGQSVLNLAPVGGTITLYAQWKDVRTGFDRPITMQGMTSAICAEASIGDTARLEDTRDGKYYNIRKMEDGKCWMVQNLALVVTGFNESIVLTPDDSDVINGFRLEGSYGAQNPWPYMEPRFKDAGDTWIQPTSVGNSASIRTTGTPPSESLRVGVYYNYKLATAGAGDLENDGVASQSICPKGWRLPTSGTTTSDWATLTGALVGITSDTSSVPTQSFTLQSAPYYLGLSGYGSQSTYGQGVSGSYMSATLISGGIATLYLDTDSINPSAVQNRINGAPVRCVAR